MKIDVSLSTLDLTFCEPAKKELIKENGLTDMDITSIVGLDLQDDGAILVSRETWKRIEIFMALLSDVNMALSEQKVIDILKEGIKPNA